MSRIASRLALLSAVLLAAPMHAVVVTDLHATAVVVPDQSNDQRARAFRAALAEVVVRLTGDRSAPESAALAPLMKAPQRFVGEFSYAQVPPAPAAGEPPLPNGTMVRTLLRVRFESIALERALREAGMVVWGRERPRTLVWLVLDDGPERDLVGAEDADAFVAAAATRALPIVWPALDGEDRAALTLADLAALDEAKVRAASARHPTEAVLAGRALRAGTAWQGQFLWLMGDEFQRFDVSGASAEAVATAAFDRIASDYVARYGVRNDALPAVVELAVEGVSDVAAYARVFDYLETLSPVRKVDLLGAAGDVLRLRLNFRGDVPTLERIIGLDTVFDRSREPPAADALRYRLATKDGAAPATTP
jgi:hypothetical protein